MQGAAFITICEEWTKLSWYDVIRLHYAFLIIFRWLVKEHTSASNRLKRNFIKDSKSDKFHFLQNFHDSMLRFSKESPKSVSRLTSYLLKKLLIQSFRSESHNGSGTSVFLLICLIQHSKEWFTVRFVKRQETLELENFHTTKSFSLFHCFIHCSALLCFRFFLGCWMGFEMTTEAGSCFELKFIANGSVDFLLLFRQDFFFLSSRPNRKW